MTLITSCIPETGGQLEELITVILNEAGLQARRNFTLALPRGQTVVDVFAEDTHEAIVSRILCECKNWRKRVSKDVVHAFRTVVLEAGAHRGYIISRTGFQSGAIAAAESTNVELVTFIEFQEIYFLKWYKKILWEIEDEIGAFNTYYEPIGKPGYSRLNDEGERTAYDSVWTQYLFAGMLLTPYSPYLMMLKGDSTPPSLPLNVDNLEKLGIEIPSDIKAASAYRELFEILIRYARTGLRELRAVNPVTRGMADDRIERDD